jgi:hypothetical protein
MGPTVGSARARGILLETRQLSGACRPPRAAPSLQLELRLNRSVPACHACTPQALIPCSLPPTLPPPLLHLAGVGLGRPPTCSAAACVSADLKASNFGLAYISKESASGPAGPVTRYCFALSKAALRGAVPGKPCDPAAPCCGSNGTGPYHLMKMTIQTSEQAGRGTRGRLGYWGARRYWGAHRPLAGSACLALGGCLCFMGGWPRNALVPP